MTKRNHRRFNPVAKELKDDRFKLKVIPPKDNYKRLKIHPKDILKELDEQQIEQQREDRIKNFGHVL